MLLFKVFFFFLLIEKKKFKNTFPLNLLGTLGEKEKDEENCQAARQIIYDIINDFLHVFLFILKEMRIHWLACSEQKRAAEDAKRERDYLMKKEEEERISQETGKKYQAQQENVCSFWLFVGFFSLITYSVERLTYWLLNVLDSLSSLRRSLSSFFKKNYCSIKFLFRLSRMATNKKQKIFLVFLFIAFISSSFNIPT